MANHPPLLLHKGNASFLFPATIANAPPSTLLHSSSQSFLPPILPLPLSPLQCFPSPLPHRPPSSSISTIRNCVSCQGSSLAGSFVVSSLACLLLQGYSVAHAMEPPASAMPPVRRLYDPVTSVERDERDAFAKRVADALAWLDEGKQAQARGDFQEALRWYTQVTENAGDLALAEYARVGRALSLYEVGDKGQAIVEMEDVSLTFRGYPEVHAALAAVLYVDKHALIPAEKQFNIATLLDPHFSDLSYVRDVRHWPPSLIQSLQKFIKLQ